MNFKTLISSGADSQTSAYSKAPSETNVDAHSRVHSQTDAHSIADPRALLSPASLSNEHLHERTLFAARAEKQATLVLLEFLAEVDSRRLYSARGYSSLFEYTHKALGYSESQASERVSAMRLLRKIPEVKAKIEREELTLTSAAKLAAFVRREEPSREKTIQILESISGKSTREAEKLLASKQNSPVTRPDHFLPAGAGITRVSFDADPEFMALFQELKNLQGNPAASICERLKAALKTEIIRKKNFQARPKDKPRSESKGTGTEGTKKIAKDPMRNRAKGSSRNDDIDTVKEMATPEAMRSELRAQKGSERLGLRSRFISASYKREVAGRSSGRCEFTDPVTKRRCESRFGLEFDHYPVPFAKGGASTPHNLRQVCREHNRSFAIAVYGAEKMEKFSG